MFFVACAAAEDNAEPPQGPSAQVDATPASPLVDDAAIDDPDERVADEISAAPMSALDLDAPIQVPSYVPRDDGAATSGIMRAVTNL